jgi:signal transduction histidine kinase
MAGPTTARQAEPGMRGLWIGILVYRWAALAWMGSLALATLDDLRYPGLAFGALLATFLWSLWFSLTGAWERPLARWVDLAIGVALLLVSGWVMARGATAGSAPFFATSYPASAALTLGAGTGVAGGLVAGVALSIGLALSRPVNGLPLTELSSAEWAALINGAFYYIAAGGAAGVVSRVLRRSARERARAVEEAARERERSARLAEREVLGREIHDSVLQSLAMIDKRGRELTSAGPEVPSSEVRSLVELASRQGDALRSLLSEPPEEPPSGAASLRSALRDVAEGFDAPRMTVTAAGPLWLPAARTEEVAAAVRQALDNVAKHARASRATVFAEEVDGAVTVSVHDDGVGFDYDEERLAREGKLGLLHSMKGRIADLGGTTTVRTAPGRGTEVEFRIPIGEGGADG